MSECVGGNLRGRFQLPVDPMAWIPGFSTRWITGFQCQELENLLAPGTRFEGGALEPSRVLQAWITGQLKSAH